MNQHLHTTADAGIVCLKEFRSSERSGIRIRHRGFFVPGIISMAGRVTNTTPRKRESVHRLRSASNLPATMPVRVEATRHGFFKLTQESSMHSIASAVAPTIFNFQNTPVRIITRDSEPWFVASDVAEALGYSTAKDAARNLADNQKGRHILPTLGGNQTVTIINESGLYRLVLRSRKPAAVLFSDWVTGEVLPTIRKTGSYQHAPKQPQFAAGRWLVSFDDQGREIATRIPNGAIVATLPRLAEMLLMPGGMAPTPEELTALAHACIQRLHARAQTKPNTQLKLEPH